MTSAAAEHRRPCGCRPQRQAGHVLCLIVNGLRGALDLRNNPCVLWRNVTPWVITVPRLHITYSYYNCLSARNSLFVLRLSAGVCSNEKSRIKGKCKCHGAHALPRPAGKHSAIFVLRQHTRRRKGRKGGDATPWVAHYSGLFFFLLRVVGLLTLLMPQINSRIVVRSSSSTKNLIKL